jgi:hypothetical protein
MAGILLNRSRQVPAEDTPAFGGIAERFRRAGDLDRAIALCRDGLKKFPDQLSARVTLGWSLLDKGQYDEARAELERVLRRAPDNLAAIRGLAELHDRSEGAMPSIDERESWRSDDLEADAALAASASSEMATAVAPPAAPTDDPFAPIAVTLASATAQPSPEVLHTADAAAAAASAGDLIGHEPEPVEIEDPAAAAMAAGLELDVTPFDPGPVVSQAVVHQTDTDETADLMAALQMSDRAPAADDIVLDLAETGEVESLMTAGPESAAAFEIEPAASAALDEPVLEPDFARAHAAASIDLSEPIVQADAPDASIAAAMPPAFVGEDPLEAEALAELLQTASEIAAPDIDRGAEPAIADLFALDPAEETTSETTFASEAIDLAPASDAELADLSLQSAALPAEDELTLATEASVAESDVLALEASLGEDLAPADSVASESIDPPAATFSFGDVSKLAEGACGELVESAELLDTAGAMLVDTPDNTFGASAALVEGRGPELVEGHGPEPVEGFALHAQDVATIEAADPAGLLSGLPESVEAPGITNSAAVVSVEDATLDETAFVPDLNYALDLADPAEVAAAEAAAAAAEAAEAAAAARRRKTIVALENFLRQVRARHLQLMSETMA